ncbi:cyclic nucleotide-binding domain-containing protein [Synechocystis sp. LKSZ1]|uniref:cyclic nucleotide-binding domain-containing protein n=1 Tax=Synechocystis sp. LKSZ1 TaxID=3144951 RepID=UPI00336BD1B9
MTELTKNIASFVQSLNSITFNFGQVSISLYSILQISFYLLIIYVLTHYFNTLLKKHLLARFITEKGVRYIIANLISYSLGAFILIIILQTTGINLSSLALIGGALGFGIGLGLQDLTRNFVSGMTLLAEQKIKIGDFIQFDGIEGYVREISPRAVVVRLKNGSSVIMPSSVIIEQKVINYHYDTETVRLTLPIGVAYGSDPVLVTETLLLSAYSQSTILREPRAQVIFTNFGDSALNLELWVWIKTADVGIKPEILSALRFAIEYNFRINHIVIPFPQRDLWLRNPDPWVTFFQSEEQVSTQADGEDVSLKTAPESLKSVPLQTTVSIRKVLKSINYFQDLNDLEIRQLIEIGQLKNIQAGEVLFRENDPGDAMYIVIFGEVEVYAEQLGKVLATLGIGSFFGELALMLGTPRTASVKALQNSLLFAIKHPHFECLLQTNLEFRETIINTLSQHQEELRQRKQELAEKGLLTAAEEDPNIVNWMRKRLQMLFGF